MHDLRWIRDNPEAFDAAMARRGLAAPSAGILSLDQRRRATQTALQELLAERNQASKEIGLAKQQGRDAGNIMGRVGEIKDQVAKLEVQEAEAAATLEELLSTLPNMFADDVPDGMDEDQNVEIRRWGTPREIANPVENGTLGEALGLIDFEAAARMSGARFTVLKGAMARLERALGQFMLDVATQEHGYTECSVPLLVKDEAVYGTGQLPKFKEDPVPDDRRALADPNLGSGAYQSGDGQNHRRRGAAVAPDRPDTLFPLGGGFGGQGHARHDPPASVLESRDGVDHSARRL